MFETPRIVPHELVNDDSTPKGDKVYQLDIEEYGEVYEPKGYARFVQVPEDVPSGHKSYEQGGESEGHGEQPYYSNDASSGKQGAGK